MNTVDRLLEITSRIEHLEQSAEWIAKESIHTDNGVSQTGTLICALAEDVRERVISLVHEFEHRLKQIDETTVYH